MLVNTEGKIKVRHAGRKLVRPRAKRQDREDIAQEFELLRLLRGEEATVWEAMWRVRMNGMKTLSPVNDDSKGFGDRSERMLVVQVTDDSPKSCPAALACFTEETSGVQPLRLVRKRLNLSVGKLSEISGIGRSYITDIEHRSKEHDVAVYEKLAAAMGLSVFAIRWPGMER